MKIYQIDSSARKEGSTSRSLAKKLLNKIKKPEDQVIYRDLDDEMLFVSGLTESGMKIPKEEQTEQHKKMFELSDKLVLELKESDVIIISVPIYNFGPPATLKAWSDLAARVKETFKYTDDGQRIGLLQDKQVYLVITSGGTKVNGKEDFLTPWLIHVLNFFGIKKIKIIAADQMALDYEKSIKEAEGFDLLEVVAAEQHAGALTDQLAQQIPDGRSTLDIQAHGGLIQHQKAWPMQQTRRQIQAAPHSSGIGAAASVHPIPHGQQLDQIRHPLITIGALQVIKITLQLEKFTPGKDFVDGHLLSHVAEMPPHSSGMLQSIDASHLNRPRIGFQQRGQDAKC